MGPPLTTPDAVRRLERIYRDHHARVRWVLRARGVDEGQLDDLVHEVFLAIHRRFARRAPDVPLAMWVDGIARNVAFSHRRSHATAQQALARLPAPNAPRTPEDELVRARAWGALAGFLAALPGEQREVFVLVEVLGVSVSEVARDVDVPLNTLHSRLRLARKRFAERFAALADDDTARAFLARAEHEARPDAAKVRRAWALIAIDVGAAAKVVGVGAVAGMLGGLAIAAGIVANTGVIAESSTTPMEVRAAVAALPRERAAPRAVAVQPVAIEEETPDEIVIEPSAPITTAKRPPKLRRRPMPPASAPRSARDNPEAQIDLLRRARRLADEQPREALALLDDYARQFGRGVLDRERFVIERDAACAGRRIERAREAAAMLVSLGVAVSVDDPCNPARSQ